MQDKDLPGYRQSRNLTVGRSVLIGPQSNPDRYRTAGEPYVDNGEWWVDVPLDGGTMPLPLRQVWFPI
jgi:hypothetical protein